MMNKKLISVKIYPSNIDVWYYDEEYEEDVCDTLLINGFKEDDEESKETIISALATAGFSRK